MFAAGVLVHDGADGTSATVCLYDWVWSTPERLALRSECARTRYLCTACVAFRAANVIHLHQLLECTLMRTARRYCIIDCTIVTNFLHEN